MKEKLIEYLKKVAIVCNIDDSTIKLDYPENPEHGDFSTNIALANSKKIGISPKELADRIVSEFKKEMPDFVKDISIAGPGFINFYLKDNFIAEAVVGEFISNANINSSGNILIEYTDPNTFKVFHIGHLMSNSIGESISRLIEYSGTKVTRICYPSDIGLHIAKSIWALQKHIDELPADDAPIQERTDFLGKRYVEGTQAYDTDPKAKEEIDALNMVIYSESNSRDDNNKSEVRKLYEKGRQWSLDHFDLLYRRLGTTFDDIVFESDMAPIGLEIVKEFLKKGIFEESEGAIVYNPASNLSEGDGKKHGLHTRVFVNSKGLPTYEAKDLGLNVTKFKKYPDTDKSIIITASEQNDYFKVLTKVLTLIDEKNGGKTKHIGHGMMRFTDGKMSSRTGNVITAEALIADIKELVRAKIVGRGFTSEEIEEILETIAIGAIKYTILRSSIGSDIAFDSASSISFEGDSGPYLQYSAVRANSILDKAKQEGIDMSKLIYPEKVSAVEKLLIRFSDIVLRAKEDYAPQIVANYLINLAGAFNSFYASQIIVNKDDKLSPYYVSLTKTFKDTMTKGLWVLGIKVPERM